MASKKRGSKKKDLTPAQKANLFKKGESGNPRGRPRGKKSQITMLKQDLEIAVRDGLAPGKIRKIVDAMVDKAIEGNVGAARLILDKTLSNAKEAEEAQEGGQSLVFQVRNLTLKHDESEEAQVIDVTPIREDDNE